MSQLAFRNGTGMLRREERSRMLCTCFWRVCIDPDWSSTQYRYEAALQGQH